MRRHLTHPAAFIRYHIRMYPGGFLLLVLAISSASGCAIAAQYQLKLLVDAMTAPTSAIYGVWTAFTVFLVALACESGLLRLSAILTCRLTIKIGVKMRLELFSYLSGQSMRYFADHLAGSLAQRVTGAAGNFGGLVNTAVWRLAPPCIDFLGALAIFAVIRWPMAVAMGTYVIAVTLALILIGRQGRSVHTAYFRNASRVAGDLTDVISNVWTVKAFSARRRELARLQYEFQTEADSQRVSWMYTEKTRIGYDVLLWLMSGAMLYWALRSWQLGLISTGDVVLISALTFRVLHGARELALALVDVSQQVGYIEDTLRTIGTPYSISNVAAASRLAPLHGDIDFRQVSFSYQRNLPVLSKVSFRIRSGEKVGIVGASGSGKSTIVQLIQRLHDTSSGNILMDGRSITLFRQSTLRSAIAVVPQEVSLFHRTIMENIRYARPGASDKEVMAAAIAACCGDFIEFLPNGLETVVGDRGVKLSGGQRQRIGIARAFLKAAPILLLDEATSALDTNLELQIQDSLNRHLSGRTVVAVAHRMSTLASFDRVLVMSHGVIVEQGSPADLRQGGTLFNKLWRLQTLGQHSAPSIINLKRGGL